jgi:hypothetical protein
VVDDPVDQRRVGDGGLVEALAGHGRADDGEDAGADDGADAQSGERPGAEGLLERLAGLFRLADELVDGFARYELAEQGSSPLYLNRVR